MTEKKQLTVLSVDRHEDDLKALERFFLRSQLPYRVITSSTLTEARMVLSHHPVDLVLLNLAYDDGTAFDLMRDLEDLPVIFLTGEGDETIAVHAMRAGAMDYLVKDHKKAYLGELPGAIDQAVQLKQQERVRENYLQQLEDIVSGRAQVLLDANQRLADETEQRAQAVEDHRQAMFQQAALDDLSAQIAGTLEMDVIFQAIQEHLDYFFDLDALLLASFDPEEHELVITYHWPAGETAQADAPDLPTEDELRGALSAVINCGELVNLSDLAEEAPDAEPVYPLRFSRTSWSLPASSEGRQPISMLLAPLIVEDQVIGALAVQANQREAFGYPDAALLSRTANVAAMGLRKAYLYQTSEGQIERLSALRSIDQAIISNLSLPTIMDAFRDQLLALLDVDAVDILLYHPELEAFKVISQSGFHTNPIQHTEVQPGGDPGGAAARSRKPFLAPDLDQVEAVFDRSPDFDQEDFQSYYGFPMITQGKAVGVLEIFHRSRLTFDQEELEFLNRLAGLGALAIQQRNMVQDLKRTNQELVQAHEAIIKGWAEALELRGIESEGHAERVVDLAARIAERMGITGERLEDVRRGAYLHDVGKMGLPDKILLKQGSLTVEERKQIARHPLYAYDMLEPIQSLRSSLEIPLYHHERWDGMGYPEGLEGEEIPLPARIFAVVDVWDSLRSDKPYRKAWSRVEAVAHIQEAAGKHFDPEVVDVFLKAIWKED